MKSSFDRRKRERNLPKSSGVKELSRLRALRTHWKRTVATDALTEGSAGFSRLFDSSATPDDAASLAELAAERAQGSSCEVDDDAFGDFDTQPN